MKEIFKQLITDFQQAEIPWPSTTRDLTLPKLPPNVRKAFVMIGMRRSGKTWILYQQMHQLLMQGVPRENLVYINFEDDRLVGLKEGDLASLIEGYFQLFPNNILQKNIHFFLDEIHEAPGWEKFVRRLLDTEKMQIYLTGSSAKLLSKEIATSLRGRTIVREVFPYNFNEYLHSKELSIKPPLSSKDKAVLAHHVQDFLYFGGFPETAGTAKEIHRELIQGYVNSVIYRDIIERYQVSNIPALKALFGHCLHNAASLLSVNKMYNIFKSQGYTVSKNSLYEFLGYFEDAFCLFTVPIYNFSVQKTTLTPKKVYPVDQGLITAYTIKNDFERAARLETTVFCHLRRQTDQIYYYKTKDGKEVDFMSTNADGTSRLYQASLSLKNPETRKREILALQQSMQELNIIEGTIITEDEEESIAVPEGKIMVIPIWKFLGYWH